MKKVLFIIPAYFTNRPQSVRFRNILPYLKDKFDLHLIFPSDVSQFTTYSKDGILIHEYHGSRLGRFINRFYYQNPIIIRNKFLILLRNGLRFSFRSILFPDLFIIELRKLKNVINTLNNIYKYDAIIVSCAPFTLLKLGIFVKNILGLKFIVDLGDPFYKNNINKYFIQKLFAKQFETKYLKYVDILIVTNSLTYKHYKDTFKRSIDKNKIFIISHGTNINMNKPARVNIKLNGKLNLVYVGLFYKKLREPFELFEAISIYNNSTNKQIYLDIYGVTPNYFVKKVKINRNFINFHNPVEHTKVNEIYERSDIIVFIDNAFGVQTPSKLFEIINSKKPVLFIYSNKESLSLKIIQNYEGAIVCKNEKKKYF